MSAVREWQFDGVVRLTKIGTAFVIFTIVIGFAAINTGNNSLYIGLAFMLGTLLLSGVASQRGLRHLHVEFDSIGEVWAGRPAAGRMRITNRSRIWNVRDVIVTSAEFAAPMFIAMIERRRAIVVEASFLFERRGIAQLKRIDLYTRYPFGFFLKKRRARIAGEVVVYPRLLDDDHGRDQFRSIEGELHSANRAGAGTDIYSFRDYIRGDSLRQVYWKKSASLGRWIVKQPELESGRAVHVIVDPFRPRGVSEDDFESMISQAATFVHDALDRGLEVLLSMPRVTLRGGDLARGAAMFRALALIEPAFEPEAQTVDRNAVVFAVRKADARQTA